MPNDLLEAVQHPSVGIGTCALASLQLPGQILALRYGTRQCPGSAECAHTLVLTTSNGYLSQDTPWLVYDAYEGH